LLDRPIHVAPQHDAIVYRDVELDRHPVADLGSRVGFDVKSQHTAPIQSGPGRIAAASKPGFSLVPVVVEI